MKNVVCLVLGLFSVVLSEGQDRILEPFVKPIRAIVESPGVSTGSCVDVHYCLYFGDEDTDRIDQQSGAMRSQRTVMLLHPVPEAAARMTFEAPHRWYAICRGGTGSTITDALLQARMWNAVPAPARHILLALGVDDPDLILVSCQVLSGSISVYYNPRHDRDRAFYDEKLRMLQKYMEMNDLKKDLPLQRIVHVEDDAT